MSHFLYPVFTVKFTCIDLDTINSVYYSIGRLTITASFLSVRPEFGSDGPCQRRSYYVHQHLIKEICPTIYLSIRFEAIFVSIWNVAV